MSTIDRIHDELKEREWSIADVAFRADVGVLWQVEAHSGEQRVISRAPTQLAAWVEAAPQVVEIRRAILLEEMSNCRSPDREDAIEYLLGIDNFFPS